MLFEAELRNKPYQINVNETRDQWHIAILEQGKDWRKHVISKKDFAIFDQAISFLFNNRSYLVDVVKTELEFQVYTRGSYRTIKVFNDQMLLHQSLKSGSNLSGEGHLVSGMPGKVIKLFVKEGDSLTTGDPILVMEAMKMENEMRAKRDAVVKKVCIEEGKNVEAGTVLIEFE